MLTKHQLSVGHCSELWRTSCEADVHVLLHHYASSSLPHHVGREAGTQDMLQ